MKGKFLVLILFYFLVQTIKAQTYFTLTPILGIGTSFSKIESDNTLDIKNNFASFFPKYGFLIDFNKNKFRFSSGIFLSRSTIVNFSSNYNIFSQDVYVFSVPIILSYDTKEYNVFYIKRNRTYNEEEIVKSNFFLMSFKLKPFAGLSIDFIDKMFANTTTREGYMYKETVTYSIINNSGVSAVLGLTVQFLQKGKERMALNFYYNQGLTNYLNASYTYTENNLSQTANVVSKGTYISIGLSYPIRIWDVDKRRGKRAVGN